MSIVDAASAIIVLTALFAYLNHRTFRLPASIGMTMMGALTSLLSIAVDRLFPELGLSSKVSAFISGIDFRTTLMDGMLSFLLFAGALHIDWSEIRRARWPILILSTFGVLISTLLVGFGFYALSSIILQPIPLIWCMVFGALISPTDPVAVMSVLKRAAVPPTLRAIVASESLFNDGVGVVIFVILLAGAMDHQTFSLTNSASQFLREAGGGIVLGALVGWIGLHMISRIDDFNIEVMITLAMVMGGYSLAHIIHVSGPVAMAVAGLMVGNHGVQNVMSDVTQDYVLKFWELIDEIFNAVLFLLIGLKVIAILPDAHQALLGLLTIPLVLLVRVISVGGPLLLMRPLLHLGRAAIPTLVWGGLRGGLSVAMALSLPEELIKSPILAATYFVVIFAIIVQGGSMNALVRGMALPNADR